MDIFQQKGTEGGNFILGEQQTCYFTHMDGMGYVTRKFAAGTYGIPEGRDTSYVVVDRKS